QRWRPSLYRSFRTNRQPSALRAGVADHLPCSSWSIPMSPVRTLIVDDCSTIRHLLTTVLSRDPDIEVAGCAPEAMREAGALTTGQDGAASTIYGMPRAAVELGAVVRQLPLRTGPALSSETLRRRV